MKTRKRILFVALALLPLYAMLSYVRETEVTAERRVSPPANNTFFVHSYGGKCLAYGAPSEAQPPRTILGTARSTRAPAGDTAVFIYDCSGPRSFGDQIRTGIIPEQVRVEEINERHEVILHAGNKIIGIKVPLTLSSAVRVSNAQPTTPGEIPLEVLDDLRASPQSGYVFALDGDSIILASNRDLVVKVQNNRGANRTPLVLGKRELADAEFWTFVATDGSGMKPTSGFVRVNADPYPPLETIAFVKAVQNATWGTVIEIDPNARISKAAELLVVPAGVTIRGDRRFTNLGPELSTDGPAKEGLLGIRDNDVRITGLRLRGPSRSTDGDGYDARGILISDDALRTIIDHNDLSDWTTAAVWVSKDNDVRECEVWNGSRPQNVRVVRNFIHHNEKQDSGYGVCTNVGGFPLIEGNTFVANRHAIKSGGEERTGYRAWYNLVLSDAPLQHDLWHTQDFDVHGMGDNGFGGRGGDYFEIAGNTFLGTDRENFDLRGDPCNWVDFHNNVSARDRGDAIECRDYCAKVKGLDNSQFGVKDITSHLGVGDFDGDKRDDVFLATGAAWYYSSAGQSEWRFINAQTDGISALRFGDFDGDGRTDVLTQHGRDLAVSWGGASKWEKLNESNGRISDLAVGDFDGDHRADIFYADGTTWYISSGGTAAFKLFDTSSFRIADLRFGDFNGDGKTDILGVVGGQWSVTFGGTPGWSPLAPRKTDPISGLVVADFNGDGRADVATTDSHIIGDWDWKVSWSGTSNWARLRSAGVSPTSAVATGRFDENPGADVLMWKDNYFVIASRGSGSSARHSTQDMR